MGELRIEAKTLDDAITKACVELGVTSDKLEYKVIEQGSKGFFGIGAKNCVISVNQKSDNDNKHQEAAKNDNSAAVSNERKPVTESVKIENEKSDVVKTDVVKDPVSEHKESVVKSEAVEKEALSKEGERAPRHERHERPQRNVRENRNKRNDRAYDSSSRDKRSDRRQPEQVKNEQPRREEREIKPIVLTEDPVERAKTFLESLFTSMDMNINYSGEYASEINELTVNLSGDDMGVLIGKRGQTLDALQYLTSQVVNKHQNGFIRVKLDTENYRERRKETLEAFAVNMAHKVKRNKRPVVLEPMNAYERRIIHSVLQSEKDIITRSEGEEPYRHVVICPVKKKNTGYRRETAE